MMRATLQPAWLRGLRGFALALLLAFSLLPAVAGAADDSGRPEADRLLPLVGSALVDAGQSEWKEALAEVQEAERIWAGLKAEGSEAAADVNSAIAQANKALADAETDPEKAKASLSALAKAFNNYVKSTKQETGTSGAEAAAGMLPKAEQLLSAVETSSWDDAKKAFDAINDNWKTIEQPIRTENSAVYAKLETSMSMIRIALQAELPRAEQALTETQAFLKLIQDYKDGTLVAEPVQTGVTVADLIVILDKAYDDVEAGLYEEADGQMASFIAKWPSAEGEVQVRSAAAYDKIEIQMASVSGYLLSEPARPEQAKKTIDSMREQLRPMAEEAAAYTAWDAALVLFREGLEAILVLAALLAYLKKTGNEAKRVWVWSGVWSGLALSGVMAVILTYVLKQASSGSTRELIEGIAGLATVALMITVGNWLHNKSNLSNWNRYIDSKMSDALARGSLWSLFAVSGLAVLREGAETTIFYAGMASSISAAQLVLGIGGALVVLIALAFVIIRYGTRLPIKPFFLTASVLIYYLVIRFVGESIHSLQVATALPSHYEANLPTFSALGLYPTWETTIPQLALLAGIVGLFLWKRSGRSRTVNA
ncbi:FTR1 family iron permease [Cohnella thailandensis]|uniref:FTR1 family protein n=1 Tax=Cohnella thailandensis TaxID=557557 RepID=A0A841T9H5_9BACL|nr:FTR1 family protein [Cohnella thailandensis]MBB6638497.1 FTR1 family protein [Cohnella thailandensis]MBP1973976.1 high-affinity iron transporter [Cohnella thailandensis]